MRRTDRICLSAVYLDQIMLHSDKTFSHRIFLQDCF